MTKYLRNLFTSFLVILVLVSITGILSFFYGKGIGEEMNNPSPVEINSQIILYKINDQYFVVTKTLFFDEDVNIKINHDSEWNKILWGNEINAEGIVRVDLGVDIQNLDIEDIKIDEQDKVISIDLPEAEILDSSLFGDLKINSSTGLIETFLKFFEDDKSEEYNLASNELISQTEERVNSDTMLLEEAKSDSVQLIQLILGNLGYDIIIE